MKKNIKKILIITMLMSILSITVTFADTLESLEISDYVPSIQILVLFTILALLPSIIIMMTSFTRIIIVLSFIRNAVGTQNTPPNQILIGLAIFLTLFIMSPVITDINEEALQPYLNDEITQAEAIDNSMKHLRTFMLKQTDGKDLSLFMDIAQTDEVNDMEDIPNTALIPAFIIGELKKAFQMGFIIFIPFIVIDMIVASTLMSMGMMMLPPVMISLPFKILLFVLVDGWHLVIKSIVSSFR